MCSKCKPICRYTDTITDPATGKMYLAQITRYTPEDYEPESPWWPKAATERWPVSVAQFVGHATETDLAVFRAILAQMSSEEDSHEDHRLQDS